ncbi:MAG: hypothetical protein AAF984_06085 [Verrucomicrobiota bacterium]
MRLITLVVIVFLFNQAHAYWLTSTRAETSDVIAEYFIEADKIILKLHLDEQAKKGPFSELFDNSLVKQQNFLSRQFLLETDLDLKFTAKLVRKGKWATMREDLAAMVESGGKSIKRHDWYAELRFDLNQPPSRIDFIPPTYEESPYPIGFIVYHKSLPVIEVQRLSETERVLLDWVDPWKSAFAQDKWKRYPASPVLNFIYIESNEVRQEVILRPFDLKQWLPSDWQSTYAWGEGLKEQIKQEVGELLMKNCQCIIDGVVVQPELLSADFLQLRRSGAEKIITMDALPPQNTLLGVTLIYPIEKKPASVEAKWNLFSEQITEVAGVMIDEFQKKPAALSGELTSIHWSPSTARSLRDEMSGELEVEGRTVVGRLLNVVGVGRVDEVEATGILHHLLWNMYRAFDYREDSKVYDKLEESIGGDLLQTVYLQMKKALTLQAQGGMQVKVNVVELLNVEIEDTTSRGFRARCQWNVAGSVGHWGHVHYRTNQYSAEVTAESSDGLWKLDELKILDEQRLR